MNNLILSLFIFLLPFHANLLLAQDMFKMPLVYQDESMTKVNTSEVIYSDTLKANIYAPVMKSVTQTFPCIIFVSGFAALNFRQVRIYKDWAKLMAANGMVGIVYETSSPAQDFDKLIEYLTANSKKLHIDKNQLGIWSASGNSLLAVNKVNTTDLFKCHAIYYGLTTTTRSRHLKEVEDMSKQNGFAFEVNGEYVAKVPTLIVRAGNDNWKTILDSIDEFTNELLSKNIPFELINYPEGRHAFDMLDNNDTSRRIILQTVQFFKRELD
jgi:dienelactone hydrolase